MRIVQQSPDLLVLRETPWNLRAVAAIVGGLGLGLLAVITAGGHAQESGAWLGLVICGLFIVVGIVLGLTACDRWIVFDCSARVARLSRRGGVLRSADAAYAFGAIRDIALESSPVVGHGWAASSVLYRIVFVMRDGSRVPWTGVSTGDMGTLARCVAVARAFGGWDVAAVRSGAASTEVARPTPPVGIPATPRAPAPHPFGAPLSLTQGAGARNVGWVIGLLSLFTLIGLGMVALQVEHLVVWRPVPASVVASRVAAVRGSKGGTSYRPVVIYAYTVGHRRYTSSTVTVIMLSRDREWASNIVQRYRPGTRTTAYVDPRDPASAYLVHEMSYFPLAFVIIPLLFAGIVLLSARWTEREAALAAATPVPVVAAPPLAPSRAA